MTLTVVLPCSGNIVGTVVRLCNAHFASSPMSSRDFPVRQGVHLFFPTRVTPTPDYPFSSSSTNAPPSRAEASGSSVRDRAPAIRRRRTGRVVDGSTFAFDPAREALPSRAQRTAEEMRSLYVDFYYNDNDHLGIDDMDAGRTFRSRTPQGDEDTEDARERGENGSSAWAPPRYRSPHPLQPPPQQRPRSPSVLSTSSSVDMLGGESLFPFPRSISVSRDRDRVSSSAFGATLDDGNPISGAGGLIDDQEHSSSSGTMRRNPSNRALSLVEELALFRQQQSERLGQPHSSSSILVRRRTGAGPDDPSASSNSAGVGGPSANRTSIRSLTIQAAPPLFSDVRRRRSVSDALFTRGDRSVADDMYAAATLDAEGPPSNAPASAPEPPLTPQPLASLPMARRRSRGRGGSSRAVTPPPLIDRSGGASGGSGAFAGVMSSLVPIIHVPPHSSPRESVSPIQEHGQDSDSDNTSLPPLDGSTNRNPSTENINLIQSSDGEIITEANQDVDEMSRLVLEELDCDGEIA
jgi:hypothetical protein